MPPVYVKTVADAARRWAKAARRSRASSLAGTRSTQKINVLQSETMQRFTLAERTGRQPVKDSK